MFVRADRLPCLCLNHGSATSVFLLSIWSRETEKYRRKFSKPSLEEECFLSLQQTLCTPLASGPCFLPSLPEGPLGSECHGAVSAIGQCLLMPIQDYFPPPA